QRGDVVDIGTVEQHRRTIRNAGELAHAGERRELRAEARLVRARPGLSHIAGRQHHEARVELGERGEAEAEALHHAGPHVLDDEVAPLRHAARECNARGFFEIDGDAVFRIVEEGEAAAAVVTVAIVLERRILNAEAVGTLARFHMNGASAEVGQHLADMGTRGIAAELEDLDAGQRLRDRGHGRLPARRGGCALAGAACADLAAANGLPGARRKGGRTPSITAKLPQKRSAASATVWKKPRAASWGSLAISATVDTG